MINSNNITIDHTNLSGDLSSFINNSESVTLSQIHPYSDVSEYRVAVAKAKEYLDNKIYARVVCEKSSIDNDSLLPVPVILMKQAGKVLVQSYSNRYPTVEPRPVLGGNHQVGDLVYNTDVSNNKCLGWICIEEGIPGTWKEVGQARSWYNEIETLDYLPQPSELQLGRQILLNENNNSSLWICKLVGNSYIWTQQDYQVGTTADRPINPSEGYIRYNTDINSLEWWTKATGWESLISTAIIGGLVDEAMEEHKLEVDESLSNLSNELQEVGSQLEHIKNTEDSIEINVLYPPKEWNVEGLKANSDVGDALRLKNIINKITSLGLKATLKIPRGNYLFDSTIEIPHNINIKGNGRNETIIKKGNFQGNLFHVNKDGIENNKRFYNFTIEDLKLYSDNSYQEGGALFIEKTVRPIIKNIEISNFNGNGITFYGTCFYAHLDSVFIHYCSSSPNGYYSISEQLPDENNAGYNGNNLRCALIDFTESGLNSREGDWATATADLTTINCNFEANDIGVRWKSADCHFISSVFQGNAVYDFVSEGSTNFSECHFETDTINNKKTSQYCILLKNGSMHLNNCNLWGNGVDNSIASIKVEKGYYININGGRNLGFKHAIDSKSLARLYSIGNDFTSKDNSPYIKGNIDKHCILNSSVGGFEINDQLILKNSIYGNIIPANNNSMNIGANDKKISSIHNTLLHTDKMFLSNQVSIFYNATDPSGVVTASRGSLCLTPLGLYVREGGNYNDTLWVKK